MHVVKYQSVLREVREIIFFLLSFKMANKFVLCH